MVNTVNEKRRFVQAHINGVDVRRQLDTGSDISIVAKRTWEKIGKPPKFPATERAATASGDPLELLFKFESAITINGEQRQAQFYVVDKSLHLAGIDILDAFGLWSVPINTYCNNITSPSSCIDSLKAAFPAVFRDELGLCNKMKIKLIISQHHFTDSFCKLGGPDRSCAQGQRHHPPNKHFSGIRVEQTMLKLFSAE